jgi:hypothetical protein
MLDIEIHNHQLKAICSLSSSNKRHGFYAISEASLMPYSALFALIKCADVVLHR